MSVLLAWLGITLLVSGTALAAPPTPSTWVDRSTVETSDPFGLSVDVVTDDEDRPHLAYTVSDSVGWTVKYKYWSPISLLWVESVVASGLPTKPLVALVRLPNGSSTTPVVLFTRFQSGTGSIWAATSSGSSWSTVMIDSFTGEPKGLDATLGKLISTGNTEIGIVYHRGSSDELWFAFGSNSSFNLAHIDDYVVANTAIHFDQTGAFHVASIAHDGAQDPVVRYARHPANGAWVTDIYNPFDQIDPDGVSVGATSAGYPRISFVDKVSPSRAWLAYRNNHSTVFLSEVIWDITPNLDSSTAVSVSPDGTVFVAFKGKRVSDGKPRLWLSHTTSPGSGSWQTVEVARPCTTSGTSGDLGAPEGGLAMALDDQANLHLAYTLHNLDADNGHHGVAYLGWKVPWATDSDQLGSDGYFTTSLALDAQEYPWICTFDKNGATYDLNLRQYTGSAWLKHTVATGLTVGNAYAHACAVDAFGSSTIAAAYSTGTGTLKLVRSTDGGGNWTTETVDAGGAGVHVAVFLSSSSTAHVAYERAGDLYYARRLGTNSWSTQLVANAQAAAYLSIAPQSNGRPAISFFGLSRLRYAQRLSNGSWTVEDVTGTGMGWDSSLTFIGLTPTISFYHQSASALWIAQKPSSSWILTEVDDGVDGSSFDAVGEMTSIVHNVLGRWKITYYNRSTEHLKIAVQEPLVSGGVLRCEEDDGGLGSSHRADTRGNPRASHKRKSNLHWRYHSPP